MRSHTTRSTSSDWSEIILIRLQASWFKQTVVFRVGIFVGQNEYNMTVNN